MKKNITVLFFSFIWIFAFNLKNYAQMLPHPSLLEKIRKGEIEMPELLKHIPELRAKGVDASWASNELKSRKLQNPKGTERFFGPTNAPTGNWKALVLLVQFTDKAQQVNATYFDNLIFSQTSGTLWDYYKKVSYNNLDIVTVNLPNSVGWSMAPQTYQYYCYNGYGTDGAYPHNARRLVEDLVNLVNPSVDFSQYDNDGDGEVDALFVVHSGQGAEYTGKTTDIWSHAWVTYNVPHLDGVDIYHYSIEPEYWASPGDMTIGVYAHELGHAGFGLPDLYDTDYSSEGLGDWSLMAGGSWNGPLGSAPSFPDAWSHIQMGYATATNVSSNLTSQSIQQTEQTPQIFKIWKNGSPGTQYFLVQNRQKTGYDSYLPGSGLAIYHVDESVSSNDNEWYPGHTSSGHYLVALEQADGQYQLEKGSNAGDTGDLFPGSSSNTNFNNSTTPNSKDYSLTSTSVSINNISSSGSTMTADLLISAGSVTVVAPNGGENWQVGSLHDITWTSSGITNVKIEYTTNNGTTWTTIIASTAASVASYIWTIPNVPTTLAKIRISDASSTTNNDVSDAVFTISTTSSLSVVSPNGGESFTAGSTQNITWTSTDVANIKIEYSINNGTSWGTIIASTPAAAGSYSWTVPNNPSTKCLIKISDVSTPAIYDQSNTVFTIIAAPTITILLPNGTEDWFVGASKNIAWMSSNVTNVKIEYSTDSGANWILLASSVNAPLGFFNWTIPNTPSEHCKVRLTAVENILCVDESDNEFTISAVPEILLVNPDGNEKWKVGSNKNISWTTNNVSRLNIQLSTDNGSSWLTIQNNVQASDGELNWKIPDSCSRNCKIRIVDAVHTSYSDTSNGTFIIWKPIEVTKITTAGQNNLYFDSTHIRLSAFVSNVAPVTIRYFEYETPEGGSLPDSVVGLSDFFWQIFSTGISFADGTISIPADSAGEATDSTYNVWLKRENSGDNWTSLGGSLLSGMLRNTNTFSDFSEFAIGRKMNSPIPVELVSFTAVYRQNGISLSWKTATETNNRGFEIEKKIVSEQALLNSGQFTSLGFIPGAGNSTQINNYSYVDKNISGEGKVIYRLRQIDFDGSSNLSSTVEVKWESKPENYSLSQNYPNPFNPSTKIKYQVPEAGWVTLKVYNVLGNEIATLVNDKKNAGNYDVEFSAKNLSSGVYIYKLTCGSYSSTKRMILLK